MTKDQKYDYPPPRESGKSKLSTSKMPNTLNMLDKSVMLDMFDGGCLGMGRQQAAQRKDTTLVDTGSLGRGRTETLQKHTQLWSTLKAEERTRRCLAANHLECSIVQSGTV